MNRHERREYEEKQALIIVLILVFICLFTAIFVLFTRNKTQKDSTKIVVERIEKELTLDERSTTEKNQIESINPLADRSIYFSGLEDSVITKNTKIFLENLPENEDFLLRYEIRDALSGDLFFETDLIEAGKNVSWIPGETLEKGTYEVSIKEVPYWKTGDKYMELSSGVNNILLTIR